MHTISFQTFFVWTLLLIVHSWNTRPFEVISSGYNPLVVPFLQPLESPIEILFCEYDNGLRHSLFHLFIFTNLSARAGYDTRPIFKRSLTGLNLEFSFSQTSCLTKAEEPSLPYYLPIFSVVSERQPLSFGKSKVTGTKCWTIGRLSNYLDAHLDQKVCDKDGVVDWCIVLMEMPVTRFEECWRLP